MKRPSIPSLGLAALACLGAVGCLNDSDSGSDGQDAPYLIITTNDEGNGYAATFKEIPSGDVDIAASPNAVQVQTRWGSGAQFQGRDFFIIASYTGVSGIHKYSVADNGKIEDGEVISGAEHFTVAGPDRGFYYDPALGKMKVQTFNPKTMERTGEIDCSSLSKGDKFEVVGDQLLAARDGKLYASLVYSDSLFSTFSLSKYDTGFVAVIDIASGKVDKVIKAPGVPFGFGYPADMTWSFEDGNGDLYLISPFERPWTAPGDRSGQIWRIKHGETDFDGWKLDSKDFGNHLSIMSGYVSDGKLYTAWWSESIDDEWSNFVTDVQEGVSIDLGGKQLSVLGDTPKYRFNANTPVHSVDGRLFFSVLNEDYNGVYELQDGKLKPRFTAKSGGAVLHFHKVE
jgi:hypothetical protein